MTIVPPTGSAEKIEVIAWATPAEGWTLDELVEEMARLGNTVLEVDRENNQLKMLHVEADL